MLANNVPASQGPAWGFFAAMWFCIVVGWALHTIFDRKPNRRTPRRVVELALVWLVAFGGGWAIFGGLAHIGPDSEGIADGIGYAPSMFQWEVGWGDIAIGVLGFGVIWRRNGWLTAAVVALAISFGGDAIGHVMQYVAHDNTAANNVWAIPSDILQPLVAIGLLVAYRQMGRSQVHGVDVAPDSTGALGEAAADAG